MGTSAPLLTHLSLTSASIPFGPIKQRTLIFPWCRPSSPSIDKAPAALPKPPTAPSVERGRGRPRKKTRIPRQRKFQDETVPTEPKPETQIESRDQYLLRRKRQPRYKCGTCCLRDCVCVLAVNENREVPIGARRVSPEGRQNEELVHRIILRAEKSFTGVERTDNYPAETILLQIAAPGFAKAPCPRFFQRKDK